MHLLSADKQVGPPDAINLVGLDNADSLILRISADNPDDLTALMRLIEARPDVPRNQG